LGGSSYVLPGVGLRNNDLDIPQEGEVRARKTGVGGPSVRKSLVGDPRKAKRFEETDLKRLVRNEGN